MDYKVVDGGSAAHLEDWVKGMIRLNYEPIGGVMYCPKDERFYQAMIRKELEDA